MKSLPIDSNHETSYDINRFSVIRSQQRLAQASFVLYAKQFCDLFIITDPMRNTILIFAINLAYNGIINLVWTR